MTIPVTREADTRVLIGASWYPEMWPESEWPRDIARMRELGFNIVRAFEFAWHRFEPSEGAYDFDWARRVMDRCHDAGIAVMVGTPTAAPPAWLTAKHPEVLKTHHDGARATHGKRKHGSPFTARYRELSRGITQKLVDELASHPAVHSWQIDNEMSGTDYGEESKRGFHKWLEARYGSVEKMNDLWGLEFWSQAYSSFDQVPMPIASTGSIEVPERHHPSLIMAVTRYVTDTWTAFIKEQCDIIRAGSDKPITTNMTGGSMGMNWFQHNRHLDAVGHSMYKDVDHYHWNLPNFDRMRAEKPRPYWLLETAPSWSAGGRIWNLHHDDRGARAISWLSTALGGTMTLWWQWREHWAGQEMLHGTLCTATGRWRPNREAMQRLSSDYEKHSRWLIGNPPASAQVGVVLSNENAWAFSIDPVDEGFRYQVAWRDDYYLPLVRKHVWRDVIPETIDFSKYKALVMPLMPIIAQDTRARLADWVRAGGRLLLGPLTGYRTEEFTAFTDREFGGLEDLMGATSRIRFPAIWIEDRVTVAFGSGDTSRTRSWCEGFDATTGEVLATYEGGYGDGSAAVVRNEVGDGEVVTLGCALEEAEYVRLAMALFARAGIEPVASGSGDVVVVPRAAPDGSVKGYAIVNIVEEPRSVTLPSGGTDLLTGKTVGAQLELAPLGVVLIAV